MILSAIHALSTDLLMMDRRSCLELIQLLPLTALSTDVATAPPPSMPSMPDVPITDKVFFDVRVARQDGSTYVRDDLPDTFENRVLKARLVVGLYGTVAPNHVERFLSYVVPPKDDDVDNPYPSYSRSTFTSLDQGTGLLLGGNIPSLRVKDIGGSTAITYGSRVSPATLWIDKAPTTKISHSTKGLLTHKSLDPTPVFGITTRACPELDSTHTVFGQILWDESQLDFFRSLEDIPTYQIDRPSEYDDVGGVATSVFNAQREFFRGAAKSVGDTRVSKLYEGKLMRRTEVMQVGKL
eukprot:CAMPEP_0176007442 /NCGR_PEP_ID=MMETSP0120_2-20121206/3235_1 /TAXON_ID=160619 /ORGANISM="Kryptoperidinium foliaceum, Strain CCMP 1326" /LENGTH=295 /DNA_ID=CAMNT_0017340203 /DNA_START=90 /DNA_END=977 /DNA_ORIENTATION=+